MWRACPRGHTARERPMSWRRAVDPAQCPRCRVRVRHDGRWRLAGSSSVRSAPRPDANADPRRVMRREQLTEKILDIKRDKGWSWKQITGEIGGVSPVLV